MSDPLTTEDLDRIAHCAATWGAVSEPDVAKLVAEVRRLKALDTKPEPTIAELAAELQRVKAALFHLVQDMTTDPSLNHDTQLNAQQAWAILRGDK